MIRYLEMWEKAACRSLWEEAFPEDSQQFDDFYFTEKMKENRVLVLEEDERIVSMLHQNPYRIRVRDQVWRSDYIVGVATAKDRRHRGYMRQLLNRMMSELWEEQMPFCFLMPADEAIYRPFGFVYIFDQPQWELAGDALLTVRPLLPWKASKGGDGWLSTLAGWMDGWLKNQYQVYTVRDEAYMRQLIKELESEAGTLDVLYHEGMMVGIRGEWGSEKREQRFLMTNLQYRNEKEPAKPAIMARIICMEQFVKAVHLKDGAPMEMLRLLIEIDDPLLAANHGLWYWNLNREMSWLERFGEMADMGESQVSAASWEGGTDTAKPDIRLTIAELTGWLFGYCVPEAAEQYETVIETLENVFLDEVV